MQEGARGRENREKAIMAAWVRSFARNESLQHPHVPKHTAAMLLVQQGAGRR